MYFTLQTYIAVWKFPYYCKFYFVQQHRARFLEFHIFDFIDIQIQTDSFKYTHICMIFSLQGCSSEIYWKISEFGWFCVNFRLCLYFFFDNTRHIQKLCPNFVVFRELVEVCVKEPKMECSEINSFVILGTLKFFHRVTEVWVIATKKWFRKCSRWIIF